MLGGFTAQGLVLKFKFSRTFSDENQIKVLEIIDNVPLDALLCKITTEKRLFT